MAKPIVNPYIVTSITGRKEPCVLFRYIMAGKIHFTYICSAKDKATAEHIKTLLNKQNSVQPVSNAEGTVSSSQLSTG